MSVGRRKLIYLHRRDPATTWATNNPILKRGQIGVEETTGLAPDRLKCGDGVTRWNDLPYIGAAADGSSPLTTADIEAAVLVHEIDAEPHAAYDDMPSLTLLFENRLI